MVDAFTTLTVLQIGTTALAIVRELYDLARDVGPKIEKKMGKSTPDYLNPDTIGQLYFTLRNASPNERLQIIYQNSDLLRNAATVARDVVRYDPELRERGSGYDIYLRLDELLNECYQQAQYSRPRKFGPYKRRATVIASLIALASLSLTYFTLFPQKKTVHAIIPASISVHGIFLSFFLLCIGVWLLLRKEELI